MKLYIMTDLEGVAGVLNGRDFLYPESRHHDKARRLLTQEVNAAIEGFASDGFNEFLVCDGHGAGAIDIELLDRRARLSRGWPKGAYPFCLTREFDAVAYVGQHAKAGTPFSHLTHTGWWTLLNQTVNEISIGEYGEGCLCAGEYDVPVIFAAGEKALCDEANALTPWVVTAAVLEGVIGGTGDELNAEQYEHFHEGAIHLQPQAACDLIRTRAAEAAARFARDRGPFKPLKLKPPYRMVRTTRPNKDQPGVTKTFEHSNSVIELFRSRSL